MTLSVVILAAGEGTRMKSRKPKVLHDLGGKSLLGHVIAAARALKPQKIIVVHGSGAEAVRAAFPDPDLEYVLQAERRGTGHALMQAMPALAGAEHILVLYGDVPLIRPETLQRLLPRSGEPELLLLSLRLADPYGYGRVLRDAQGRVQRVVEEKDASAEERGIDEINTGILCARAADFARWLKQIRPNNAKNEYYLTDCIALAAQEGIAVRAELCEDLDEAQGINDRAQLAALERAYQRRCAAVLMAAGVSFRDPARIDIRGDVQAASDVEIDVNVIFEGRVILGEGVKIGPNCLLRDVAVAPGCEILANSIVEGADIGAHCRIGPFARIRPGTQLAEHAHIGNFVEIKKSRVGENSKINHLSYIGDSVIGQRVNIGAGTITCNYDGADKHETRIGDDVFIGSDTQLVAPVVIGDGATIGAGSTITKDAPAEQLTLSRSSQQSRKGWRRPQKKSP